MLILLSGGKYVYYWTLSSKCHILIGHVYWIFDSVQYWIPWTPCPWNIFDGQSILYSMAKVLIFLNWQSVKLKRRIQKFTYSAQTKYMSSGTSDLRCNQMPKIQLISNNGVYIILIGHLVSNVNYLSKR